MAEPFVRAFYVLFILTIGFFYVRNKRKKKHESTKQTEISLMSTKYIQSLCDRTESNLVSFYTRKL